jgi:hypothetical protein
MYRSGESIDLLRKYAERRKIRFVDAPAVFSRVEKPERLYLRNAPRLSIDGHSLYARVLERTLLRTLPGSPANESTDPRARRNVQAAGFESRAAETRAR